jgi:hypothetical protein
VRLPLSRLPLRDLSAQTRAQTGAPTRNDAAENQQEKHQQEQNNTRKHHQADQKDRAKSNKRSTNKPIRDPPVTAYSMQLITFMSLWVARLPTLRCTNTSPGPSPSSSLAGTRESEQPIL